MSTFAFLSDQRFMKVGAPSAATPYAVAGVAWDGATTNRPGARMGPRAIRQASHLLCDGLHPHFNVTPELHLGNAADVLLPNTSLHGMREALQPQAAKLLAAYHMAWIGGDHSITLPLLREYRKHLGRPLAGTTSTPIATLGQPLRRAWSGHGTWVYEAMQEGLVVDACFTQLGIRSPGQRAARDYVQSCGGQIFTARQLRGLESPAQLAPVLGAICSRLAAHGNPPVYLSLDIDCLDPAFAPDTGTPEPGGLSTNQVLSVLEELADLPFVGMDCVEASSPYDHAELTSYAAGTRRCQPPVKIQTRGFPLTSFEGVPS